MENVRLSAALRGDITYTGSPCRKCSGTTRFVSNASCKACSTLASKEYQVRVRAMLKKAKAAGL